MFIHGGAGIDKLTDVEALTMIINTHDQLSVDKADFDMDLFGRVTFIGVADGISHRFGQYQVEIVREFLLVACIVLERSGNILPNMPNQTEITRLIGNLDIDSNAISWHRFSRFSAAAHRKQVAGKGFAQLETGDCILRVSENLEDPMQAR